MGGFGREIREKKRYTTQGEKFFRRRDSWQSQHLHLNERVSGMEKKVGSNLSNFNTVCMKKFKREKVTWERGGPESTGKSKEG